MKSFPALLGLAFVIFACETISADIVHLDFEELPTSPGGGISTGSVIDEDGFRLLMIEGNSQGFSAFEDGWQNGRGASNGTVTLGLFTVTGPQSVWTLSTLDATLFNLLSIDVAELFQPTESAFEFSARTITIEGTRFNGSTVTQVHNLDLINDGPGGAEDFETVTLSDDFRLMSEVSFMASSGNPTTTYYSFDNIFASRTAIPEPGSLTILLAMAIPIAVSRRRR